MEQLGKVAQWQDDKGFGFIQALDDATLGGRVFFHIHDYQQSGRRPEPGELVRFIPRREEDGRLRARRVRRAVQPKAKPRAPSGRAAPAVGRGPSPVVSVAGVALDIGALAWAIQAGRLPGPVPFGFAVASTLAYIAYALDKDAAQRGRWRIAETTLHLFEFAGGWPGALLAQHVMRHKTRKASYRRGFRLVVLLHCVGLAAWIFRDRLPF